MSDDTTIQVESAQAWAEAAQPPADTGPLTVEEAARETRRKREESQPVEYKVDDKPVNLRTAQRDYAFTKKLNAGKQMLDQGMTPEQAFDALENDHLPRKVGDRILEDDEKITDSQSVRGAARDLTAWRERLAAEQAEALQDLTGDTPQEAPQSAPEPAQPQQPDPVAQERQRLAMEHQKLAALQRMTLAEAQAVAAHDALAQQVRAAFPEAMGLDPEVIEKMRTEQPQRFQQLVNADMMLQRAQAHIRGLAEQRQAREVLETQNQQAANARHRAAYNAEQDRLFNEQFKQSFPSADQAELQRATRKMLNNLGVPDHEVTAHFRDGVPVDMRSVPAQLLLAKAAMWDMAQAKAKEIRARPLPPVQKPGVSRPAGASDADQIRDIQNQLRTATGNKAILLGTKLTQLMRARGN